MHKSAARVQAPILPFDGRPYNRRPAGTSSHNCSSGSAAGVARRPARRCSRTPSRARLVPRRPGPASISSVSIRAQPMFPPSFSTPFRSFGAHGTQPLRTAAEAGLSPPTQHLADADALVHRRTLPALESKRNGIVSLTKNELSAWKACRGFERIRASVVICKLQSKPPRLFTLRAARHAIAGIARRRAGSAQETVQALSP